MMGLGSTWTYTPNSTGIIQVVISGFAHTATANAGIGISARFGTGTAPVNAAAASGTRVMGAGDPVIESGAVNNQAAFNFQNVLSLTAGTAYWFDIAMDTASASDTATLADIGITVEELTQ